jgi:hypothetical protein
VTEINQHVGVNQRDLITEVSPDHNLNAFTFGDTNNRLSHTTGRSDKCDAKFCHRRYGEPFKQRRLPDRRIL